MFQTPDVKIGSRIRWCGKEFIVVKINDDHVTLREFGGKLQQYVNLSVLLAIMSTS
jgi:hypothetical protein